MDVAQWDVDVTSTGLQNITESLDDILLVLRSLAPLWQAGGGCAWGGCTWGPI